MLASAVTDQPPQVAVYRWPWAPAAQLEAQVAEQVHQLVMADGHSLGHPDGLSSRILSAAMALVVMLFASEVQKAH